MAKLFEEVLNGNVHAPSADIIVHFACQGDALPMGAALPFYGSGASPGGARPVSPRAAALARPHSSGSPVRGAANGGPHGGAAGGGGVGAGLGAVGAGNGGGGGASAEAPSHFSTAPASSLKCHSLVLRTQPTLFEVLLSNGQRPCRQCSSAGTADTCDMEGDHVDSGACWCESASCQERQMEGAAKLCDALTERAMCDRGLDGDRMVEVTVDDEPEVFLEMIKFVYLNSCHVDHSNVKALMQIADKYGIEDIVTHCLQWMQDHFDKNLFNQFLSFELSSPRFGRLLRHSLRLALRSRRHFSLVTGPDSQWEQLPVSFIEALLSGDELPVTSEAEVLHLVARWANGALARDRRARSPALPAQESPTSSCGVRLATLAHHLDRDLDGGESVGRGGDVVGAAAAVRRYGEEQLERGGRPAAGGESSQAHPQAHEDMLRLLRAFRKSDMLVKISDVEPILEILNMSSFFSTKSPRETAALDPGFMIYRGVAGVNVPATLGELHEPSVVPHAWRGPPWRLSGRDGTKGLGGVVVFPGTGGSVSLGSHDFLQQQDGFKPSCAPDRDVTVFPRLWVRLTCSSWSHREKRMSSKNAPGLTRHSMTGPIVGDPMSSWDCVSSSFISAMTPVNEAGPPEKAPPTLKTMQSQDDWEIGRKGRGGSAVPNLSDAEKIDHKVICAVISGHIRHGIRIGQHERSSIYYFEDLAGQAEEVCIGGTPTEVEFELQLSVRAPSPSGICRCSLAVLPSGDAGARKRRGPAGAPVPDGPGGGKIAGGAGAVTATAGGGGAAAAMRSAGAQSSSVRGPVAQEPATSAGAGSFGAAGATDAILEICFDASAEEHLHFHMSSSHFDSNSSYSVALNWVLRPGMPRF